MNINQIQIGEKIKTMRKNAGFSQQQIADYLELDRTTITKIEKGERNISVSKLEAICNLCGYTLLDFIDNKNLNPLITNTEKTKFTKEDLNAIYAVNRIALNLRWMKTKLAEI